MAEPAAARHGERGFTLVEVLVAFVVALLILGATAPLLRQALGQADRAEADLAALGQARSLLARIGNDIPLLPGETGGDLAGGGHWRLAIVPWAEAPTGDEWAPILYQVAVQVAVGSGRAGSDVRLTTLRLGPPPPSGAAGP
jgi:general secretion pathway protein I